MNEWGCMVVYSNIELVKYICIFRNDELYLGYIKIIFCFSDFVRLYYNKIV